LIDAIDRYDPNRGATFEAYARFRIRRAIRHALTDQSRLIRLPKQVVERRRALERAEARLAAGGEHPTAADLAAATGLSVSAVVEAREAVSAPVSLDEPVLPDGSPLESLVADPGASDPELETLASEQSALLRAALARLPERKRRVVAAQWGLDGQRSTNGVEIAAELDLSPRRTQTIGQDALHDLREILALSGVPGRSP
jgi:RNA polymerase sigma factor (sigma-70 family)